MKPNVNTIHQVDGKHYESPGVQHWDYVEAMGLGYLEGNATKYICRWGKKYNDYRVDVKKVISYIQKLRSLHQAGTRNNRCLYAYGKPNPPYIAQDLRESYGLSEDATIIIHQLTVWTTDAQLAHAERVTQKVLEELNNG